MEFYTYIWKDATGLPFYVGKGTGRRAYETRAARRSSEFLRIHDEGGCTVEIVDWFIHESQAHEVELIARYGRREIGGLLINRTDGGEGASGSSHSEEARAKIAETNRRVYADNPSRRAKVSEGNVRRWSDPGSRVKQSAALAGKPKSDEHKASLSASHSGKKLSAEHRANIGSAFRGITLSDEHRAKVSSAARFRASSTGFKGVCLHKQSGKWQASIKVDGKFRYLGTFATPELAAERYDAAAITAWGVGNCYLNFPTSVIGEAACIDPSRYQVRPNTEDARLAQTAEQ